MPGITPYRQIRYPLAGEVGNAVALQNMATDIDTVLGASFTAAGWAAKRPSASFAATTFSLAKLTTTAFSLTVNWDNGGNVPGLINAPFWNAGQPTRVVAPVTGLYMVQGTVNVTNWPAHNALNWVMASVARNGVAGSARTSKRSDRLIYPVAAFQQMWVLNATDYLQLSARWDGAPAGPLNVTGQLSIHLMALP